MDSRCPQDGWWKKGTEQSEVLNALWMKADGREQVSVCIKQRRMVMMKVEEPCLEMSLQTSEAAGNLPNNNNNNRWLQVRAGIQLLVSRMVLLEWLSTA